MKSKIQSSLLLLGTTIIWGSAFIAQRSGINKIGPFTFQTIRCILAVFFLFPAATIRDIGKMGVRASMRIWLDADLLKSGFLCGIALFAATSLQQQGLVETDAGKAGFLTAMYIVLVPLLGCLLGKRPPVTVLISVVPAIIGLYLLSWSGNAGLSKGDLCLIGCAFAFSVQITLIDRIAGNFDSLRLNCIQAAIVVLFSIPFMLTRESVVPSDIAACWIPLSYAGILSMGVAYTLQILGQRGLEPTTASLIMSMESVFALLFGVLILHESLTIRELSGCLLVFCAVILSQLPGKKSPKVVG